MAKHWGALRSEWDFFVDQGLGEHLLPVVSNPNATISRNSSLKGLGKTPSLYNYQNEVTGIANWTNIHATPEQIRIWCNQVDYGVCLIARLIKGIDVDVTNARLASQIRKTIEDFLLKKGIIEVPTRSRKDSPKFLVAIRVEDAPLDKHTIDVGEDGIIELLSNKQQFIAAGTHPSGARYEWEGLEYGFPVITKDDLVELWQILKEKYGTKKSPSLATDRVGLRELSNPFAVQDEPIYNALVEKNMITSEGSDPGSFNIVCPFAHEHTTEGGEKDSSTTYFAPHTGGHAHASIKCLHAHCSERTTEDFKRAIGLDGVEDFAPVNSNIIALPTPTSLSAKIDKYTTTEYFDFEESFTELEWITKGIIQRGNIGTMLGPPSVGKTFNVIDLMAAVARGIPWQGRRCKQGRVIYVAAEGGNALKARIKAYNKEHGLKPGDYIPVGFINTPINLLNAEDVAAFITAQRNKYKEEGIALVIFDTYAQCMIGDENSSHDTGIMIRALQKIATALNAAVLAVHHTGKNPALGGRGHSSLFGAVDFEIYVTHNDPKSSLREIYTGKLKDGEGFHQQFKLKKVHLGVDSDGDDIHSCVVVNAEPGDYKDETPKLRTGEQMTLDDIYEYQKKGTGQWPDIDVLVDIIRSKEIKERGKESARKPFRIKRAINTMIEHGRGITLTKDNRVVPIVEEVENDDNAQHDSLSVDNNESMSNVTPFPK